MIESALLLVQFTCKPVALFCCALFAGASTYISLVEQPAIASGGADLAGSYLEFARPRPAIFQTSFGAAAALAGLLAGLSGAGAWWVPGSVLVGFAVAFYLFLVIPRTRGLLPTGPGAGAPAASDSVGGLARLHAIQSVAAMAALFVFIMNM